MIRINAPESQRTLRNHKERFGITNKELDEFLVLFIYATSRQAKTKEIRQEIHQLFSTEKMAEKEWIKLLIYYLCGHGIGRSTLLTEKRQIDMVQSWFECKVTYERAGEKGLNTKVNEVYLVQGFTFTEIEKRLTQELQPQVTGEFNINKMERTKYNELVDSLSETADKWYKCKITMVTIDEVSAKEKKSSVVILVKADDVTSAVKNLNKHMEDSIMDYTLASVNESPIVDIFHYEG